MPGKGDDQEEPARDSIEPRALYTSDAGADDGDDSQHLNVEPGSQDLGEPWLDSQLQPDSQDVDGQPWENENTQKSPVDSPTLSADAGDQHDEAEEVMPASDEVPGSGEVAAGSQKRKFLKDMTPNSKEAEIERRKQAKRVNSNKWHATWASKGVRKEECEPAQPADRPVEPPGPAPGPVQPVEEADGFQPVLDMMVKKDMRTTRYEWMNQYMNWKKVKADFNGDMQTLRKESAERWLNSQCRAQMMASRVHQQF